MLKFFRKGSSLASVRDLRRYELDEASQFVFDQAMAEVLDLACCRLTTSFLLFAMAGGEGAAARFPLFRYLHDEVVTRNPDAYYGVKKAYLSWYRGNCHRLEGDCCDPRKPVVTPYVMEALDLARSLSKRYRGSPQIRPPYLLGALLAYDPGAGAIQPGMQYILDMLEPGLGSVRQRFCGFLQTLAGNEPDAGKLAVWLGSETDTGGAS